MRFAQIITGLLVFAATTFALHAFARHRGYYGGYGPRGYGWHGGWGWHRPYNYSGGPENNRFGPYPNDPYQRGPYDRNEYRDNPYRGWQRSQPIPPAAPQPPVAPVPNAQSDTAQ